MPHIENTPGLNDLDRLSIGDIAALPPICCSPCKKLPSRKQPGSSVCATVWRPGSTSAMAW